MEKKDVATLSELLGISEDVVEASVKDGTLDSRIKDFKGKNKIYSLKDFETFQINLKKGAETDQLNNLLAQAKEGKLDGELYKYIKAATLEMKEKELSEEFEIKDYRNLDDLVKKIVKSKSGAKSNEEVKDLEKKVEDLQEANVKLKKERDTSITSEREKYKGVLAKNILQKAVDELPYDLSGVDGESQMKVLDKTKNLVTALFSQAYKLNVGDDFQGVNVSDKEGNVLKDDATLNPKTLAEVVHSLAKENLIKLKSPEQGGRGGGSSQGQTGLFLKTKEDFENFCKSKGVNPMSMEGVKFWKEAVKANPQLGI
jgi:hypothetical protein